jgi:hypothetical protein
MATKFDTGKEKPSYLSYTMMSRVRQERLRADSIQATEPSISKGAALCLARLNVMAFLERIGIDDEIKFLTEAVVLCNTAFDPTGHCADGFSKDFRMEILKVREFGANKYAPDNWKKGFPYKRGLDAALRHLNSAIDGESQDPETGLSHLAHAVCSIEHVMWTVVNLKDGFDDRYLIPENATKVPSGGQAGSDVQ